LAACVVKGACTRGVVCVVPPVHWPIRIFLDGGRLFVGQRPYSVFGKGGKGKRGCSWPLGGVACHRAMASTVCTTRNKCGVSSHTTMRVSGIGCRQHWLGLQPWAICSNMLGAAGARVGSIAPLVSLATDAKTTGGRCSDDVRSGCCSLPAECRARHEKHLCGSCKCCAAATQAAAAGLKEPRSKRWGRG